MSAPHLSPGALPLLDWRNCSLFLDFDGTLVDIASHPEAVRVEPLLPTVLAALHTCLGGRIALVSGRPVAELDRMLAPLVLPVAGVHGMERRCARGTIQRNPAPALEVARALAAELAAGERGLWVEEKHGALALHYRDVPAAGPGCIARLRAGLADQPELLVMEGKMVVEVKAAAVNKGTAICDFCSEPPFAGTTPVFIGDDTTDEAGFAWVQEHGGTAVKVGDGPSLARHRIGSAADLRGALAQLVDTLAKEG